MDLSKRGVKSEENNDKLFDYMKIQDIKIQKSEAQATKKNNGVEMKKKDIDLDQFNLFASKPTAQ